MPLQKGRGGKEIILNDYTLTTVKDVIDFYSDENNVKHIESKLTPNNWQYYNCMMAEFRHNVGDHHEIGWENMTKEYYESLSMMSDDEIETFLKNNPAPFDVCFIKHGFHRAVSMIGRMINGKPYIPFYMEEKYMYDEIKSDDGRHRVNPIITNVNGLNKINIPRGEFTITQSGILALMGIRQNDDVDIIISSAARHQMFNNSRQFIRTDGCEIFEPNKSKFRLFGAHGDDDLIKNYSVQIGGYNFLEPRFYFSRKNKNKTTRDVEDWNGIKKFFSMKSHLGYPYSMFSEEQWGLKWV
jgi:hypothetical protein